MTVAFVSASAWFDGATGLTADKVLTLPSHYDGRPRSSSLRRGRTTRSRPQMSGYTEITEFADGTTCHRQRLGLDEGRCLVQGRRIRRRVESDARLQHDDRPRRRGAASSCSARRLANMDDAGLRRPVVRTTQQCRPGMTISASSTVDVPSGASSSASSRVSDDSATFTRPRDGYRRRRRPITWNGNYVEAPATHASTTTGNDMAADAGYRLVTTGAAPA